MGLNTLSGLISGHWPQIVKSGYKTNKLIRLSITVKHAIQLENWLSGNRRKRLVIGNPRVKNIFIMFIKISAKVVRTKWKTWVVYFMNVEWTYLIFVISQTYMWHLFIKSDNSSRHYWPLLRYIQNHSSLETVINHTTIKSKPRIYRLIIRATY